MVRFHDGCVKCYPRAWNVAGYPPSFLASPGDQSLEWRLDFLRTFLERDLLALRAQDRQTSISPTSFYPIDINHL